MQHKAIWNTVMAGVLALGLGETPAIRDGLAPALRQATAGVRSVAADLSLVWALSHPRTEAAEPQPAAHKPCPKQAALRPQPATLATRQAAARPAAGLRTDPILWVAPAALRVRVRNVERQPREWVSLRRIDGEVKVEIRKAALDRALAAYPLAPMPAELPSPPAAEIR